MNGNLKKESHTTLSETDTVEVLADISSVIFEAALGRLLLSLDEEELVKLEQYLEEDHAPEMLVEHLVGTCPSFQQLIDEEVEALEEKAKALNTP